MDYSVVDSIQDLKNLSGVQKGEKIRVLNYYKDSGLGGGIFEVVADTEQYYLALTESGQEHLSKSGLSIPVTTADEVIIKFRLRTAITTTKYLSELKYSGGRYRMLLSTPQAAGGDFRIASASGMTINWVKDVNGNTIDHSVLYINQWYEYSVNFGSANTVTNMTFGTVAGQFTDMDISYIKVGSEEFTINENTGVTTTGSLGTVLNLIDNPAWNELDLDDKGIFIQSDSSGNATFKRVIESNIVTPFDYGAISTDFTDSFIEENDASGAIQAAFDSGYNVMIPAGNLYIINGLFIRKPISVWMFGTYTTEDDWSGEGGIGYIDRATTTIYSDKDIDYITIQAPKVEIHNGLLDCRGVSEDSVDPEGSKRHNRAAFRYDLSYRMWGTKNSCSVIGNENNLLVTPSIGTIGVFIDGINHTKVGYLTDAKFTGKLDFCSKGVYVPSIAPGHSGTFRNDMKFNNNMDGCKMFYDIKGGDLMRIKSTLQDRAVMPVSDSALYGVYVEGNRCTMDTRIFDTLRKSGDPAENYRHSINRYFFADPEGILEGQSLIENKAGLVDMGGFQLNRETVLRDPFNYVLSDYSGMISKLDNAIRYAGETGNVTYKGYKAPDANWFVNGNNLFPANVPADINDENGNITDLSEDTDVTFENKELLLTSSTLTTQLVGHRIADVIDRDLYFAEIVIDNIETIQRIGDSKIRGIFLKTEDNAIKSVQVIVHFDDGIYDKKFDAASIFPNDNLFDLSLDTNSFNNSAIRKLIIRLIGQEDGDFTTFTHVTDVILKTQYDKNPPYLPTYGGKAYDLDVEALTVAGKSIQPKIDTAPTTVTELLALIKTTGLIHD